MIDKNIYFSQLKVIDCRTRSVVMALPNCEYAALSYVWGPRYEMSNWHTSNDRLPSVVPRTIDDAISLVRHLGWNYLWIDRYCINQNDDDDKSEQIGRMGDIYAGSTITIIAAAGDDDEFGLLGVGSRCRAPQPYAYIRRRLLVSTLLPQNMKYILPNGRLEVGRIKKLHYQHVVWYLHTNKCTLNAKV